MSSTTTDVEGSISVPNTHVHIHVYTHVYTPCTHTTYPHTPHHTRSTPPHRYTYIHVHTHDTYGYIHIHHTRTYTVHSDTHAHIYNTRTHVRTPYIHTRTHTRHVQCVGMDWCGHPGTPFESRVRRGGDVVDEVPDAGPSDRRSPASVTGLGLGRARVGPQGEGVPADHVSVAGPGPTATRRGGRTPRDWTGTGPTRGDGHSLPRRVQRAPESRRVGETRLTTPSDPTTPVIRRRRSGRRRVGAWRWPWDR